MSKMPSPSRPKVGLAAMTLALVTLCGQSTVLAAVHPSQFCHVTDGVFTSCSGEVTPLEWSDVPATAFQNGGSFTYVNQDPLDAPGTRNLYLMYDIPLRATPLGVDEFTTVEFDTTKDGVLERYYVLFYGDSSIQVVVDDTDLGRGAPGEAVGNLLGAVGFGPSPNDPSDHLMFELTVPLQAGAADGDYVGGVYSPDPAWWNGTIPPETVCCDRGDGIAVCIVKTQCDGLDLGPCPPGSIVGQPCEQPPDELVCCEEVDTGLAFCTPAADCDPDFVLGPCPPGSTVGLPCEQPSEEFVCCDLGGTILCVPEFECPPGAELGLCPADVPPFTPCDLSDRLVCCQEDFAAGVGSAPTFCIPAEECSGRIVGECPDALLLDPCPCCRNASDESCQNLPLDACRAEGGFPDPAFVCEVELNECFPIGLGIEDGTEISNAIITANEDGLTFVTPTPAGFEPNVQIDIKPGNDPNSINCHNARGVIPVAILTTEDFDATTVDHTTVRLEGASEKHVSRRTGEPRRHEEDVDNDGDTDLVFHFVLGETGLGCDSVVAILRGETFDGTSIEGFDLVRMVDD